MPGQQSGKFLLALVAAVSLGLLSITAMGVLRRAEEGAPANELRYVQAAITTMMTHNQINVIPNPVTVPTNDMTQFPDSSTLPARKGLSSGDRPGYVLYRHDNVRNGISEGTVDYIRLPNAKWYYTAVADGTVTQWEEPSTEVR
ncbi:MAG: hypothetical protein EXR53_05615 [Dehalococcoidia bacterium]|nr:hypothetical protein [Dehalococcoidia bacterium]